MDTSYLAIILIMLKEKISFRETLCTSQLLTQKKTILCFYAPNIYLGFHTTVEKFKNGEKVRNHTGARQCHYCNNHFVKSAEKMKKHLSCCARKAEFFFFFFFF